MRTSRLSLVGTVTLALLGGLGSAAGVAAQDEADAMRLVTEQVEPGVERIISDAFGHDLDATHPTYRYDMDGIGVAPDGTVWLMTTYHGSDNEANPGEGWLIWALGRPGTYGREQGLSTDEGVIALDFLADGTLLVITGEEVLRLEGGRFVPDEGPMLREMGDGRFLLRIDAADLAAGSPSGPVASIRDLYAVWDPGNDGWTLLREHDRSDAWTGDHWCSSEEDDPGWGDAGFGGVSCQRGWQDSWRSGPTTTYLERTFIGQVAASPDGSVWAVGDYDGGPGGLYRITVEPLE